MSEVGSVDNESNVSSKGIQFVSVVIEVVVGSLVRQIKITISNMVLILENLSVILKVFFTVMAF